MVFGVVGFKIAASFDGCTEAFGLRPRFAAVFSGSIFGVATGVGTALDVREVFAEAEGAAAAFLVWAEEDSDFSGVLDG